MKNHLRTSFRRDIARTGLAILLLPLSHLCAQTTLNWTGGSAGGNTNWSTSPTTNWSDGGSNTTLPSATTDLVISTRNGTGSLPAAMLLGADYSIHSITFDNTAGRYGSSLTIENSTASANASNRTLTFATAGIDIIKTTNISVPIVFRGFGKLSDGTTNATLTLNLNYTGYGNINLVAGSSVEIDSTNGVITGTGGINKTGGGTLILSGGANTFTGGLTISGGTVAIDSATELGSSASPNTDAVDIVNGTLQFTATSGSYTNSANRGMRVGNQSSVIEVTNAGVDLRLSSSIRDISGQNGVLTKTGAGNLSLEGGTYSYTGGTLLNAGILTVNGSTVGGSASIAGITVASGATLRGSGTFNGDSTFAAGSIINVGTYVTNAQTAAIGTMTFNNALSLAGGTYYIDLAAPGSSDLITSNSLNIGNGVFDLTNLQLTALTGYSAGTYTIFSSSTTIVGTFGSTVTGTLGGLNLTLALDNNGTTIDLLVGGSPIPEPSIVAAAAGLTVLAFAFLLRRRKVTA